MAWWLARLFTRPLRDLAESTRAIKAGNYRVRAKVRIADEVGVLAAAFNDMARALQRNEAVRAQLVRKLIAATEEERQRVARELHDHMGQALASLIAGLAALGTMANAKQVEHLQELAKATLSDAHELCLTLRPSALDDLGLVAALQHFCSRFAERFGVEVNCAAIGLDSASRLPREIEGAFYRIGQEALTNAVRHGKARSIELLLQRKSDSLLMVVEDNGQGFEAQDWRSKCSERDHLGLLGVEERAVLLGGSLRVQSLSEVGTSLFVEIPLTGGAPIV